MLKLEPLARGRREVIPIYSGTECAIVFGAFFTEKVNFGVSVLVKSRLAINFGVSL